MRTIAKALVGDDSFSHARFLEAIIKGIRIVNTLLHFLMVEAAQATVSGNPECCRQYPHLALRRGRNIDQVRNRSHAEADELRLKP
jgi:hypothetical protein